MDSSGERDLKQKIGLWTGPALAVGLLLFADLDTHNSAVTSTAAVAALMAVWWITEAIPIPATALLPIPLFPLLGIMDGRSVASTYFNNIILLFIGGFIVALAMQKWNLHRRVALWTIRLIGGGPKRIVLSFMLATAFLSMWISNTATTMMMVPIALSVILRFRDSDSSPAVNRFAVALLLGIAYSASIGGMATLIGTPPNLAFVRIFAISFPEAPEISFAEWLVFALPLSITFVLIAWGLLQLLFMPRTFEPPKLPMFRDELSKLGRVTYEEKVVLGILSLMAFLWLTRIDINLGAVTLPGWSSLWSTPGFIDDGTVAIAVALLLFILPSRSGEERLMDWKAASQLNWGIVILFGGGFALAAGFKESGLSTWVAERMQGLGSISPLFQVMATSTIMTFLTEFTSNTATTQIVLPLLSALTQAIKTNPLLLMIPATLSASCAFMMPVATPPNAIVFGSGEIRMADMVKAGLIMNLVGVVLITALIFLVGPWLLHIDPGLMPEWVLP
ncbi:SLC13 family permease [bacterium]|nr:SLC13 family permease [bacterium]